MTRTLAPLLGGAASHYHGPGSPLYLRALFAVVGAALVRATMPADAILDPESNKGKMQGPHSLRETFRMHGRDLATGGVGAFILMFIRECRNVIIALKGDDLGLTHIQIGTAPTLPQRMPVRGTSWGHGPCSATSGRRLARSSSAQSPTTTRSMWPRRRRRSLGWPDSCGLASWSRRRGLPTRSCQNVRRNDILESCQSRAQLELSHAIVHGLSDAVLRAPRHRQSFSCRPGLGLPVCRSGLCRQTQEHGGLDSW